MLALRQRFGNVLQPVSTRLRSEMPCILTLGCPTMLNNGVSELQTLGVPCEHILHDGYAGCVKLVHHLLRRNTNGTNEQGCLVLDDDVRQLGQLPLGVIILEKLTERCQYLNESRTCTNPRWSCEHFRRPEV